MGLHIPIIRVYLFPIDPTLLPPTTVHMCQLKVVTEHPLLVPLLVAPMVHVTTLRRVPLPITSMYACACVCV